MSVIQFTRTAFALVILVLLAAGWAPASDLLVNGNFETGNPSTYTQGQTVGAGWTVDVVPGSPPLDHSVDLTGPGLNYWTSYDGLQSLDLDGSNSNFNNAGAVSQTFADDSGSPVVISFQMGGNFYDGDLSALKTMELLWDGSPTATFDYSLHAGDTRSNFTWDSHSLTIPTARVSGNDTITFRSLGGSGYGPVIDAVSAVPEPTSLAAVLVMAVGLLYRRRYPIGANCA
jgi:hypothetical protein